MADAADRAQVYQEQAMSAALARHAVNSTGMAATSGSRECRICGYKIEPARLRAIPHAVTCVACQQELEQ